jgi:hypothetical protein
MIASPVAIFVGRVAINLGSRPAVSCNQCGHGLSMIAIPGADDCEPLQLDGSLGPEVLKPAPEEALREWKVSPRLNRTGVGDDDPTIIEPLSFA